MTTLLTSNHLANPSATNSGTVRPRLDSIDLLRGAIMVLMALDHVREFMTSAPFDPLDPTETSLAYYATRWITHLCAPLFVFLAGTSAFLYQQRGRSTGEVSWFLVTRGLWLVVLNFTVVWYLGWSWQLDLKFIEAGIINAIGISMIVLAGVIWLPRWAIAAVALGQVFGHNLLDGIQPGQFGDLAWLWTLLHVKGGFALGSTRIDFYYPLIPWMGVMMLGYLFGPTVLALPEVRRQRLLLLGFGALALFFSLRLTNVYGDLHPWSAQATPLRSAFAFFNVQKYPPSLDYLLVTLGLGLLGLLWLQRWSSAQAGIGATLRGAVLTFGRVPLFFYLVHLPLCHTFAFVACVVTGRDTAWLFGAWTAPDKFPYSEPGGGFGLLTIYGAWLVLLVVLYPACRWLAQLKQRRRDAWLSYL
jgi:uncharacterized membrane protein